MSNSSTAAPPRVLTPRRAAPADSVRPTPQSHFLRGTAALNVSRAALTEAPAAGAKEASCALARLGAETLAAAREGLTAGQELAPDAARQYLEYVDQLSPFAEKQLASFCGQPPASVGAAAAPPASDKPKVPGRR